LNSRLYFSSCFILGLALLFGISAPLSLFAEDLSDPLDLKNAKGVFITGRIKAFFENRKITSNFPISGSQTREVDPLIQVDIGFYAKPTSYARGGGVLRMKNRLGSFFGPGDSVEVREAFAEFTIDKKIGIRFGDLYRSGTPFSLWIHDPAPPHEYTNYIFSEEDRLYDAFLHKRPARRIRGVNIYFALEGERFEQEFSLIGGRLRKAIYERYFLFLESDTKWKGHLTYKTYAQTIFDIQSTALSPIGPVRHSWLFGGLGKVDLLSIFGTSGEGSDDTSRVFFENETSFSLFNPDTQVGVPGKARPAVITGLKFKRFTHEAGISYRYVDPFFISPLSQARTYRVLAPREFTNVIGSVAGILDREYKIDDEFFGEGQTVIPGAVGVNLLSIEGGTAPSGRSTRNRSGLELLLKGAQGKLYRWNYEIRTLFLEEIRPVGSTKLRNYIQTYFGLGFAPDEVKWFIPRVKGFYTYDETKRADDPAIAGGFGVSIHYNPSGFDFRNLRCQKGENCHCTPVRA